MLPCFLKTDTDIRIKKEWEHKKEREGYNRCRYIHMDAVGGEINAELGWRWKEGRALSKDNKYSPIGTMDGTIRQREDVNAET